MSERHICPTAHRLPRARAASMAFIVAAVTATIVLAGCRPAPWPGAPWPGVPNRMGSAAAPVDADAPRSPAEVAAENEQRQLRIFRELWGVVNERYIYPDFNGFDWPAARDQVESRISAGLTVEQFHAEMSDLIDGLNDDHSNYLTPDEATREDAEYSGAGTFTGVGLVTDVNRDAGHIYVLAVLPDSPAARAGIEPHDAILEIDGQPSVDAQGNSMSSLLRGEAGTTVEVLVRTPGQAPRVVAVARGDVNTTEPIVRRVLPGDKRIGYLGVPSLFEESVTARTRDAVRELTRGGRLEGLILDLRTNGGGSFPNLRGLLSLFTSGAMGDFVDRAGERTSVRVRANGIGNSQTVPLVVLIGPSTESFAEVLAGSLQAKGRARLVGQNSAGNIETLMAHQFEDGSRLWLAQETFRLPDGTGWELIGLTPDVRVDAAWDEYTADDDPVLAEAVKLLE